NAQVGSLECKHIVDTVAHHRDIGSLCTQLLHETLLLLRSNPSKDRGFAHDLGEFRRLHLRKVNSRHILEIGSEPYFLCQGRDGVWVVTGDDLELYTCDS